MVIIGHFCFVAISQANRQISKFVVQLGTSVQITWVAYVILRFILENRALFLKTQ